MIAFNPHTMLVDHFFQPVYRDTKDMRNNASHFPIIGKVTRT
jgi:hypothetical protein